MTYASLARVIVLGSATLLTDDPRFVLAKPSIAHFAIGTIMLKRGWMLRYVPPIVAQTIPEYVTFAGYAWAALMIALGAGTIAVQSQHAQARSQSATIGIGGILDPRHRCRNQRCHVRSR